jgi:DNA-binding transcriptional LysR family regulator
MALSSIQLEAFYSLAQTGNFTKAAEKLHVTQSALSQRIMNLESDLETTLFIRDRAGLRLTPAGEDLLRYCQTKNSFEEEFLSSLKSRSASELSGVVRIAGFSSIMRSVVLPALTPLAQKNPHLQLQFLTREMDELLPLLKKGEVDFVLNDRLDDREELESLSVGEEHNVLVERPGYAGEDVYLDHDEKDPVTLRYLKLAKLKSSGKLARHFVDDVYGILDGVKLGLGRGVLPRHIVRDEKKLSILQPRTVLEIPIVLHFFRQPYYSKLHQAVVKELQERAPQFL